MPEIQVFPSTNPYYSTQTQAGGNVRAPRQGWCAAASALWGKNRLLGVAPAESNPDKLLAGILQVKYRWDPAGGGQDFINIYNGIGRTAVLSQQNMGLTIFLSTLLTTPGVYHIDNGGHSMALDTRGPLFYFYDIENGLYSYDDPLELVAGVRTRYPGHAKQWLALHVT